MRVRCIRLIETAGANRGASLAEHPHLKVGDEFIVSAILFDPQASDPWKLGLQVINRRGSPTWWPAEMFETVSNRIPSNWTIQLWDDGSLHLAPDDWLQPGFWEACFDGELEAVAAYRRERAVIVEETDETG